LLRTRWRGARGGQQNEDQRENPHRDSETPLE
jgi:hypothetical protein